MQQNFHYLHCFFLMYCSNKIAFFKMSSLCFNKSGFHLLKHNALILAHQMARNKMKMQRLFCVWDSNHYHHCCITQVFWWILPALYNMILLPVGKCYLSGCVCHKCVSRWHLVLPAPFPWNCKTEQVTRRNGGLLHFPGI